MLKDRLDEYIRNTALIRVLSYPDPSRLDSGTAYSETLRTNFIKIGEIAQKNRAILSDVLEPMFAPDRTLTGEEVELLNRFHEQLLNASSVECLDVPLSYHVSVRMMEYAMKGDDVGLKIRQADYVISSSYAMINLTKRLGFGTKACRPYREYGFLAADYLSQFLSEDALSSLPHEELREIILVDSRFMCCLYEGCHADPQICEENLKILKRSEAMADNPRIRALVPHYDWKYHQFRLMEYIGAISEHNNSRGATLEQRRYISDVCSRLLQIWDSDPEYYKHMSPRIYVRLMAARSAFLCGRTDRDSYMEELCGLYRECESERKNFRAAEEVHYIIGIPLEYIYALERPSGFVTGDTDRATCGGPAEPLTKEQTKILTQFYYVIEERALYTIGTRSLTYLLEFLSMLLLHFIEVPGVSFMQFCLSTMRVLHPPTYVHTMMVGEISQCLCRHVIESEPELIPGPEGYRTAEEIQAKEEGILSYIRDAALCHDFGKIPLIDIIFVYGRRLFDFEFDLIREHPDLGTLMLERIPSMRKFADVVRGHHKWFDNSQGYPTEFCLKDSSYEPLIDIVTCADCMDAATDSVGRSYSRGKTLDEYISEVEAGSGSRYASYLSPLMRRPDVHRELEEILNDRREEYYQKTYEMLKRKRSTVS